MRESAPMSLSSFFFDRAMIIASHVKWKYFLILIPLIGLIRTHKLPEFMNTPFWILDNNQIISSPQQVITGNSDKVFKLAQPHGIEYLKGLHGRSKQTFTTSQENQKYIFPHHINLKYDQAKEVRSATLVLNDSIRSNLAHIDKDFTPDTIRFEFAKAIRAGTYKAKIEIFPPAASLKVETKLSNKSEFWLITTGGGTRLSYLDFLESIFHKSKIRFSLILLALLFLLSLSIMIQKKYFYQLLLASLILSVLSITDPMSGYDETAHLDLMHQSFQKSDNTSLSKKDFLEEAFSYMMEHDFYFLHKLPPVPDHCPHKVVGYCSSSERVKAWYSFIANFLPKVNSIAYFSLSHIIVSIILLLTYLLCSKYFLSISKQTLIVPIILSGAFWSTLPSITNDTPIYIYGLIGLSIIIFNWLSNCTKFLKTLISFVWIIGSYHFIRELDRSWVICLLSVPLLMTSCFLGPFKSNRNQHSLARAGMEVLGFFTVAILSSYMIIKYTTHLDFRGIEIWKYLANNIDPALIRIHKSTHNLTLESAKFVLVEHIKSLFGSFVWGHSYYKNKVYWLLSLLFYWLSVEGWNHLKNRTSKTTQVLTATSLSLALTGALMTILLISLEKVTDLTYSIESFTKIRLIAPILSIYLFLPALGVFAISKHKLKDIGLRVFLYSYTCIVCIWYLPRFFFYDKFW